MQNMPSFGKFSKLSLRYLRPSCCWEGFLNQQWTYGGKHERGVINCWSFCVWHSEEQCCSFQWNSINPQIETKFLSSEDEISFAFRISKKTHCWKWKS